MLGFVIRFVVLGFVIRWWGWGVQFAGIHPPLTPPPLAPPLSSPPPPPTSPHPPPAHPQGSYYYLGELRLGQGREKALAYLKENPEVGPCLKPCS